MTTVTIFDALTFKVDFQFANDFFHSLVHPAVKLASDILVYTEPLASKRLDIGEIIPLNILRNFSLNPGCFKE